MHYPQMRHSWQLVLFLVCLETAVFSFGQQSYSIHGIVEDSSGAVLSHAQVVLESPAGLRVAVETTSSQGLVEFEGLEGQKYVLVVPAVQGFAENRTAVMVKSTVERVRIVLVPGSAQQVVVADASQSLSADAGSNLDSTTIAGSDLQHMPVFDQDYVNTMAPFLDPASSASDGITIMVNGVEMKKSMVSPSAIAEVRINDDPYSAEYSRPGRGRINIIPKPGSSELHGTENFIARDAIFNASNFFATVRPPEQRRIYEGDLTGPIRTDHHTTFVASGDRKEDDTIAQIHAVGPAGLIATNVPAPQSDTQISMTVSHDFSSAHRASVGYNFELERLENSGVGGLVLGEAGVNSVGREDDLILSDRIIISPRMIHQVQLIFEKDEDLQESVTDTPSIQVQDAFIGGGAQQNISRTENTVHISDVVSWVRGKHYVRFGANIPQISRRALDDKSNRLGTFMFTSLGDYINRRPDVWTAQQGIGRGLYWINELGAFIQDEVTLRKDLLLTLGMRYQWQTYITDGDNFAPRLAVAWSINPHTVLRAGGGVFYDRTGGDFPGTFKVHNGKVLHQVQLLNPGYPSPLPPGVDVATLPSSIVREAHWLHTPYTFQYSSDLEKQLNQWFTLTVGYRGITGVSTFRSRDANAPLPPTYGTVPDPSLAFVQQIESGGRMSSNALELTLRGRANHWFTGQAKYDLSRTSDNSGGINWYPQDQYHPNDEWGRSSIDRLHRFNLIGNIHQDHWLTLGVATTLYSNAPIARLQASILTTLVWAMNVQPVWAGTL